MTDEPTTDAEPITESTAVVAAPEPIAEDVLVEEVSIDGMCGVY